MVSTGDPTRAVVRRGFLLQRHVHGEAESAFTYRERKRYRVTISLAGHSDNLLVGDSGLTRFDAGGRQSSCTTLCSFEYRRCLHAHIAIL